VFEAYWSVEYVPGQVDSILYQQLPTELATISPGPYKLYVNVLTADGSVFSEKEVAILAREQTDVSVLDDIPAYWGDCETVSTGSDNGFLECAVKVIGGSASRNSSTNGAFSNLRACLSSVRSAVIYGHGDSGLICTGDGDACGSSSTTITHSNGGSWIPYAATIKDKASSIKLAACKPGAGAAGSTLLYKMAQATNVNVSGPTGLLWCSEAQNKLWIEGYWKTATPTEKPPAFTPVAHLSCNTELHISTLTANG